MTKKQKQLRKQTWKFFWQQKGEEILGFLKVVVYIFLGGITIVFGIIVMVGILAWCGVEGVKNHPSWLTGIGLAIFSCWIIYGLYYWINSNWKSAIKRAEEKMNKEEIKNE